MIGLVGVARLRRPRRDWALVEAAGPLSNLAIAVVLSAPLPLLAHTGLLAPASGVSQVLAAGIFVNALLAVFDRIPIPPRDGSRIPQLAPFG